MKQTIIIALMLSIVLPLSAQFNQPDMYYKDRSPWSVELRSGASFSTQNLGNAVLRTGFGFEGTCSYRVMTHLETYAGWGWNRFSSEQSFAGPDMDFEETGYTFGLQFIHPIANSSLSYMVRGGGIYNHIETENSSGDIVANSGHGLGWQAEAGLAIPLSNNMNIIPSVRYRSLDRNTTIGTVTTETHLHYFSTGAALSWGI